MKSLLVMISALLVMTARGVTALRVVSAPSPTKRCGCSDASLCHQLPPRPPVEQEIMGYCLETRNAPLYNWTMLTTMANYGADRATGEPIIWTTYCLAKSHGVRFALAQGNSPTQEQLKNETIWKGVVDTMVAKVVNYGYDGLHFDWELYGGLNQKGRESLSAAVTYLSSQLKSRGLQFTAAVEVIPTDTLHALAVETDFLMIMDYDRSAFAPGPNARYAGAVRAIDSYSTHFANVSTSFKKKLVLGLPWYGHYYGCTNEYNTSQSMEDNVCETGKDLGEIAYSTWSNVSRGEPTSFKYTLLNHKVNLTVGYARLDYIDKDRPLKYPQYKWNTVYYDTPATLKLKYAMAGRKGIRGVSMWTIDYVSYERSAQGAKERAEMWDAVDAFLHPSDNKL